ncbi:methylated-DNA--[protein]-cysteine S-methyltransferase [Lutimaribacter marinistellae]|uniref:Methylated-DNA--protein-cysteine methyltransferase n=1 Tax=Lutimaribacter marinistellae TaxID=1820329 RepID=A0ABV7THR7_9RHOB
MSSIAVDTGFGMLTVTEEDGEIVRLDWGDAPKFDPTPILQEAAGQLQAYDRGELTRFDLPLAIRGSDLQRGVMRKMLDIPFGETRTYGDIARALGVPAQAVGQACGANPIPIIIPCHRVMGAKGLTGYSGRGGVETKVALLRHEGAASLLI